MNTRSLARCLAGGALLTLAVAFSPAQTVRAHIPFNFVAGSSSLAAGGYTVQIGGRTERVLAMCGPRQRECVSLIATVVASRVPNDLGKIVFHRYGNRYFLSEIWSRSLVQMISEGSIERQIAKPGAEPAMAVIAAELTSRAGR